MKHLVFTAHPSSKGFTHKIAKAFLSGAEARGDDCEIIDLYSEEFSQDFLKFENIKEDFPITDVTKKIQKKMSESENYVFICPMWWYLPTSRMKNFFDMNLTPGFAYKYTGKMLPEKLLMGKTAQIFMTCDGPAFYYFLVGNIAKTFFKRTLGFCGIKVKSYSLISSMIKLSDSKKVKILEKVSKKLK